MVMPTSAPASTNTDGTLMPSVNIQQTYDAAPACFTDGLEPAPVCSGNSLVNLHLSVMPVAFSLTAGASGVGQHSVRMPLYLLTLAMSHRVGLESENPEMTS